MSAANKGPVFVPAAMTAPPKSRALAQRRSDAAHTSRAHVEMLADPRD